MKFRIYLSMPSSSAPPPVRITRGRVLYAPDKFGILCRTHSRATTGLHYVFVADGNGDILFEKIIKASEDWDILPGNSGEIIIGGARTKTVISPRK